MMTPKLLIKARESEKSMKAGRIALIAIPIVCCLTFVSPAPTLWPTGIIIGAAVGAYVYWRTADDMKHGFWMEVWDDKVRFRDGTGEHEIMLNEIYRILNSSEGGATIYLLDETQIEAPGIIGIYLECYQTIYKIRPTLFRDRPF